MHRKVMFIVIMLLHFGTDNQLYINATISLHLGLSQNSCCNYQWYKRRLFWARTCLKTGLIFFTPAGHEVIFSLCTASDYVKDKNANRFGFLCHVVGYEQDSLSNMVSFIECEAVTIGECVNERNHFVEILNTVPQKWRWKICVSK